MADSRTRPLTAENNARAAGIVIEMLRGRISEAQAQSMLRRLSATREAV